MITPLPLVMYFQFTPSSNSVCTLMYAQMSFIVIWVKKKSWIYTLFVSFYQIGCQWHRNTIELNICFLWTVLAQDALRKFLVPVMSAFAFTSKWHGQPYMRSRKIIWDSRANSTTITLKYSMKESSVLISASFSCIFELWTVIVVVLFSKVSKELNNVQIAIAADQLNITN